MDKLLLDAIIKKLEFIYSISLENNANNAMITCLVKEVLLDVNKIYKEGR